MIINEFENRLLFQLGDAVAYTAVRGTVAWVVVAGTSGQVIGSGYTNALVEGSVAQVVVPKTTDVVAQAADPQRIKKITDILLTNDDVANAPHRLNITEDYGGSVGQVWTGVIPASGSLSYSNGRFTIYNSTGRVVGGGGYNPGGW